MNLKSIHLIPEICHRHGLQQAVLSPGSRCAALSIAFARHKHFTVRTISDERSAAFIGLGISQQTKKATILVCTSGTAAANYQPAIIEAWYQQIPLLVITADRPPEWIDQSDGQSIRQENIYGKHIKGSFQFPVDTTHADARWHAQRMISEAINLAHAFPPGPVHINIPIREPFYPDGELEFDELVSFQEELSGEAVFLNTQLTELQSRLASFKKILIVIGQDGFSQEVENSLIRLSAMGIPVIADVLSNLNSYSFIHNPDLCFLNKGSRTQQQPELLITIGKTIISKTLKLFLRKEGHFQHWHIQQAGQVADPFCKLSLIVRQSPEVFLKQLFSLVKDHDTDYKKTWEHASFAGKEKLSRYILSNNSWNELYALSKIQEYLNSDCLLHISNSMAIRYASYLNWGEYSAILYCNRGTSGIDGSMSTAVGAALATDKQVYFITGDLSFFYDRNALWNNYLPENLKVIVLNNHGGAIFNMIDGPAKQPEAAEYFVTQQKLRIENTIKDTGAAYWKVQDVKSLQVAQDAFFTHHGTAFLEVETSIEENTMEFKKLRE